MKKKNELNHAGTGHVCGECAFGTWNKEYKDYYGKPFMIYCKRATYAYSPKAKEFVSMADSEACEGFKAGQKNS